MYTQQSYHSRIVHSANAGKLPRGFHSQVEGDNVINSSVVASKVKRHMALTKSTTHYWTETLFMLKQVQKLNKMNLIKQ